MKSVLEAVILLVLEEQSWRSEKQVCNLSLSLLANPQQ